MEEIFRGGERVRSSAGAWDDAVACGRGDDGGNCSCHGGGVEGMGVVRWCLGRERLVVIY